MRLLPACWEATGISLTWNVRCHNTAPEDERSSQVWQKRRVVNRLRVQSYLKAP